MTLSEFTEDEIRSFHKQWATNKGPGRRRDTVAWAIKRDISPNCQTIPTGAENPRFQILSVRYQDIRTTITNLYLPPDGSKEEVEEIWHALENNLPANFDSRAIMGDLNGLVNPSLDRAEGTRSLTEGERATKGAV